MKLYPHSVVPWTVTKRWLDQGKFKVSVQLDRCGMVVVMVVIVIVTVIVVLMLMVMMMMMMVVHGDDYSQTNE